MLYILYKYRCPGHPSTPFPYCMVSTILYSNPIYQSKLVTSASEYLYFVMMSLYICSQKRMVLLLQKALIYMGIPMHEGNMTGRHTILNRKSRRLPMPIHLVIWQFLTIHLMLCLQRTPVNETCDNDVGGARGCMGMSLTVYELLQKYLCTQLYIYIC